MSNTKNKMLIDATHPEETRVVVLRNGRIEEFDWESASRKLLRGNIYLAKVTRVEPSLQAAFVDYGGNRHGFLAFSEIHPDYYQIPMADRQALLAEEARAEAAKARAEEDEDDALPEGDEGEDSHRGADSDRHQRRDDLTSSSSVLERQGPDGGTDVVDPAAVEHPLYQEEWRQQPSDSTGGSMPITAASQAVRHDAPPAEILPLNGRHEEEDDRKSSGNDGARDYGSRGDTESNDDGSDIGSRVVEVVEPEDSGATEVETVGAEDAGEEIPDRPRRMARHYKIQEVIRRRQIILVQVVKEERGNKGAALTTYLSLAGRYTVLMPNTARGGGISRKIANSADRKRLRKIVTELEVPKGMGLIVRTAGASRTKAEIKRDFEYLLRLWESVRDLTLRSTAPALVYEEGDLIKRSIRDLYTKEIDEIVVAGEQAHSNARDFMQMLMPSHVGNVIPFRAPEPLFTKFQIERQLNAMFSPFVTLRSGGYIVINQTEALVSIDINSGKSTREHNIEDTAFKTNLEASEEIARQLKLRDLAGLIVIDYIDMEEKRNNRAVERRLKECLRHDRARIQVGRISHFGLLEMSRQRLRPGVLEGSTSQCPHCQGTGTIRSTESVSLSVLRGIEDKMISGERFNVIAHTTADVASYILNQKRHFLNDMESRYGVTVTIMASDKVHGANFLIERGPASEDRQPVRRADVVQMDASHHGPTGSLDADPADEDGDEDERPDAPDNSAIDEVGTEEARADSGEEGERRGRRRRRRRRGRNGAEGQAEAETGLNDHEDDQATTLAAEGDEPHENAPRDKRHAGRHRQEFVDGEPSVQEIDSDGDIETIGGDSDSDSEENRESVEGAAGDDAARQGHSNDDRNGEGRRRRRGRRGGRRGGRDRDPRDEGTTGSRQQDHAVSGGVLPIASPDEWMSSEPTVGDLAAEERRRTGREEQPPYHSQQSEAGASMGGYGSEPLSRPNPMQATYPQVMAGAAAITVVGDHSPTQAPQSFGTEADVTPAPLVESSAAQASHGAFVPAWSSATEPSATASPAASSSTSSWRAQLEPAQSSAMPAYAENANGAEPVAADNGASNAPVAAKTQLPSFEATPVVVPAEPLPPPEPLRPARSGWWNRKTDA